MSTKRKLSGEERREAILAAARGVFAVRGFRGTTTKALAEAAEVSEALLFKHFPTKESLYAAMQASYATKAGGPGELERLEALTPSTATLVQIVHQIFSRLVLKQGQGPGHDDDTLTRLMFHSVMEDGDFARMFVKRVAAKWAPSLEACIKTAIAEGELVDCPVLPRLRAWFTHHLAVILLIYHLQTPSIVDYGTKPEDLVRQAVWFCLRGIGLKEEVIRQHYPLQGSVRGGKTR